MLSSLQWSISQYGIDEYDQHETISDFWNGGRPLFDVIRVHENIY